MKAPAPSPSPSPIASTLDWPLSRDEKKRYLLRCFEHEMQLANSIENEVASSRTSLPPEAPANETIHHAQPQKQGDANHPLIMTPTRGQQWHAPQNEQQCREPQSEPHSRQTSLDAVDSAVKNLHRLSDKSDNSFGSSGSGSRPVEAALLQDTITQLMKLQSQLAAGDAMAQLQSQLSDDDVPVPEVRGKSCPERRLKSPSAFARRKRHSRGPQELRVRFAGLDGSDDGGCVNASSRGRATSRRISRGPDGKPYQVRARADEEKPEAESGGSVATAAATAGGAVAGGAAGGAGGLLVGAAAGLPAALFTFGLSIPIGAVVGSGAGVAAGTALGGLWGYRSSGKQKEEQAKEEDKDEMPAAVDPHEEEEEESNTDKKEDLSEAWRMNDQFQWMWADEQPLLGSTKISRRWSDFENAEDTAADLELQKDFDGPVLVRGSRCSAVQFTSSEVAAEWLYTGGKL